MEGSNSKAEQGRAITLLNDFAIVELTVSDFDWATQQLIKYRLINGIDAFDSLLAAPSYRLQLPLLGNLAQEVYA